MLNVSATARKLAVIIWNMLVKKQPFQPSAEYLFPDQNRKLGLVKRTKKQIAKFESMPMNLILQITYFQHHVLAFAVMLGDTTNKKLFSE